MTETEITLSQQTWWTRIASPCAEVEEACRPGTRTEALIVANRGRATAALVGAKHAVWANPHDTALRGKPAIFRCQFMTDEEAVAAKLRWDGE